MLHNFKRGFSKQQTIRKLGTVGNCIPAKRDYMVEEVHKLKLKYQAIGKCDEFAVCTSTFFLPKGQYMNEFFE